MVDHAIALLDSLYDNGDLSVDQHAGIMRGFIHATSTRIPTDAPPKVAAVCPLCHQQAHARACAPLRERLMDADTTIAQLRDDLANAYDAIGGALALVRQGGSNAAILVLKDALKGSP